MAGGERHCTDCGVAVCSRNVSGFCRRCVGVANMRSVEARAKVSTSYRRRLQADPAAMAAARQRLATARDARDADARRERWIAGKFWLQGQCSQPAGSPARVRAGQRQSATKLAWCPPHLRADYRFLTVEKRLPAAEARELIERHHVAELARWSRQCHAGEIPA
jgi:hypothetical protein